MKTIYLGAGTATLAHSNVTYQDKIVSRDLGGCMLDIDLAAYDIIVATPPCNYYSKASNYPSLYALESMHLLPGIIKKCENFTIPILIENVINKTKMLDIIYDTKLYYIEHGRHSYFSNININISQIPQTTDFKNIPGYGTVYIGKKGDRQGGRNVNDVIDYFLEYCEKNNIKTVELNKVGTTLTHNGVDWLLVEKQNYLGFTVLKLYREYFVNAKNAWVQKVVSVKETFLNKPLISKKRTLKLAQKQLNIFDLDLYINQAEVNNE